MAKKAKNSEKMDYAAEVRALKTEGAQSVYLLSGDEDYLRESFITELRKACVNEATADFDVRVLTGLPDLRPLREAVGMVPFMSERSLVLVRDLDVNKCRDAQAEELKELLSDLPDYCTLVFVLPVGYEADGRLTALKTIKKHAKCLEFTAQGEALLLQWISRRFAAQGKSIRREDAEYLMFLSGTLMNQLIPEIEKLSSYAAGETVTRADIQAVANRLPEADVFEMVDDLSRREYDRAAARMATLLRNKEHPIKLMAIIGMQMRRIYAARLVLDGKAGRDFLGECCKLRFDSLVQKSLSAARGFTTAQAARAVQLCAETDYRMKSSSEDDEALLKDFLVRFAAEG